MEVGYPDFESCLPNDPFPIIYEYYRVDSETELIEELSKEVNFLVEDIEGIYYDGSNVSSNYLDFDEAGAFYRCKASIRSTNNETNN